MNKEGPSLAVCACFQSVSASHNHRPPLIADLRDTGVTQWCGHRHKGENNMLVSRGWWWMITNRYRSSLQWHTYLRQQSSIVISFIKECRGYNQQR